MKVRIFVSLKPGVLDPQGRAVHHALEGLGFQGVEDAGLEADEDADFHGRVLRRARETRAQPLAIAGAADKGAPASLPIAGQDADFERGLRA